MKSITNQSHFRAVQRLSFCYLCGLDFKAEDSRNRDHVPPQGIFLSEHREPMWLPTHTLCNNGQTETDEKIGQLVALRYGKVPKDEKNRRLEFLHIPAANQAAVVNLEVDAAVWRWVRGCHSALYGVPLVGKFTVDIGCALVTPFPRAPKDTGEIEPIKQQHYKFVDTIKVNRAKDNMDRVVTNKGKFVYECVWAQADGNGPWMCIFAIDIYDWKDLGATKLHPARGCAGFYICPDGRLPAGATVAVTSDIIIPNVDPLDPFGP
jgi:hypothetical protein